MSTTTTKSKPSTTSTEEQKRTDRLLVILTDPHRYDEETGDNIQFRAYTKRITPLLRDQLEELIDRDHDLREQIKRDHPHYHQYTMYGEHEGEKIACPHCLEVIEYSGSQMQLRYVREHQQQVTDESNSVAKIAKKRNVEHVFEMIAAIIDPEHPALEVADDPDQTDRRREWLRSEPTSEFWRSQDIPGVELVVKRFRHLAHI